MFIIVRLLNNFSKELTYAVPVDLQGKVHRGTLVQVPLQRRLESAIVVAIEPVGKTYEFKIRPIDSIFPFPEDSTYRKFATHLAAFHQIDSLYLFTISFLSEDERKGLFK